MVDEPVTFSSGVTKQDVTVADCHAVGKVLLWEENVGNDAVVSEGDLMSAPLC